MHRREAVNQKMRRGRRGLREREGEGEREKPVKDGAWGEPRMRKRRRKKRRDERKKKAGKRKEERGDRERERRSAAL